MKKILLNLKIVEKNQISLRLIDICFSKKSNYIPIKEYQKKIKRYKTSKNDKICII